MANENQEVQVEIESPEVLNAQLLDAFENLTEGPL
jgi:hypothetical protein